MTTPPARDVTRLLLAWNDGDPQALEELLPLVYEELHRLAKGYMRRERPDHTLQPTALVNEAYLQLVDQSRVTWQNRAHFIGVAAQLMRRIAMKHARRHRAEKRGGHARRVPLTDGLLTVEQQAEELLALDTALEQLTAIDPRQGQIVELRYFGGLTIEEAAEFLGLSTATVKREWRLAKAFLASGLQKGWREDDRDGAGGTG